MYEMNSWKKEKIESQADTLIERQFEIACSFLNGGADILNEWRARKLKYSSYTNMIVFDFQHYSKHDASHSVNILESIELILGKERIQKLSAGDLWLLLECAYFHDIGMALLYTDLVELWSSEDFQKFVMDNIHNISSKDADMKNAALWYKQADNLLRNRTKMENIENEEEIVFKEIWPVEMERNLLLLVAEYIRRDHANGSRKYLERFGSTNSTIQVRLYKLVAVISATHGLGFEAVMDLEYEEKGFGIDRIHPRFAAMMLRIGDLLDMDNNRFNIRAVEHYGELPWTSEIHLRKHKSLTHILISPDRITATAENKNTDVCRVTAMWFRYIESEVKNLICHWNDAAPTDIGGCIMKMAECKVYHPQYPVEFCAERQLQFEVDKIKLTDLLIGINIYDSKMDFLREYIQNAIDATKMQIWLDVAAGKYDRIINPSVFGTEKIAPFDLPDQIYENYAIEIEVEVDAERQVVHLLIKDKGIGIEEDCIKVISKIGSGWRRRKRYSDEIPKMWNWLKPTGGFGIGIQSAFMATDCVEFITRSAFENTGYKVTMHSPRTSGELFVETRNDIYERGTSVKLDIGIENFQEWNFMRSKLKKTSDSSILLPRVGEVLFPKDQDIFDQDSLCDYIIKVLKEYFENTIENSFIPIKIKNAVRATQVIKRKYMFLNKFPQYWKKEELENTEVEIVENDIHYRCIYNPYEDYLVLWNMDESIYTYIKRLDNLISQEKIFAPCFKNILVSRMTYKVQEYVKYFNICIDFMGQKAEEALKVHRNSFNESFIDKIDKYLKDNLMVFYKYMRIKIKEEKCADNLSKYPMPLIWKILNKEEPFLKNTAGELGKSEIRGKRFVEMKGENGENYYKCVNEEIPVDILVCQLESVYEREEGALFIANFNNETNFESKITQMVFNGWANKKTAETELARKSYELCNCLRKCDFIIYTEESVVNLLWSDSSLRKQLINFGDVASAYLVSKQYKTSVDQWRTEKNGYKIISEREFYKNSFEESEKCRYIEQEDRIIDNRYKKIMVMDIPYEYQMISDGPYLISPISPKIKQSITAQQVYYRNSNRFQNYGEFEKIVTDNSSYRLLLQWVYDHQVESKRYTLEEIDKEYREYIRDIFQNQNGDMIC